MSDMFGFDADTTEFFTHVSKLENTIFQEIGTLWITILIILGAGLNISVKIITFYIVLVVIRTAHFILIQSRTDIQPIKDSFPVGKNTYKSSYITQSHGLSHYVKLIGKKIASLKKL